MAKSFSVIPPLRASRAVPTWQQDGSGTQTTKFGAFVDSDVIFGKNFFEEDFNTRQLLRMHLAGSGVSQEERSSLESWLSSFGALVGEKISRNAEIIDKHPPRLIKFDRFGSEIDFVEHHPSGLETRKLLWEHGRGAFGGQHIPTRLLCQLAARHMVCLPFFFCKFFFNSCACSAILTTLLSFVKPTPGSCVRRV